MRAERTLFPFVFAVAILAAMAFLFPPRAFAEDDNDDSTQEQTAGEGEARDDREESAETAQKKGEDVALFEAIMKLNAQPSAENGSEAPHNVGGRLEVAEKATATLPLAEYDDLSRRVEALRKAKSAVPFAPVVLGAASYEGQVEQGVLAVRMKLLVTLSGDGMKFVPLVGDDTALVSATAGGEPMSVTRRPGYHVWVTHRQGVVSLELSFLVGPRGGRGSIEYAFRSAKTPSTRVRIRLPSEGLSPRFDDAVESEVIAEKGSTTARATLSPTTLIRLVGFRDIGTGEQSGVDARPASSGGEAGRAFAETISLLSVDERAVELFTVVRYTILRGAMQSFDIALPEGFDVISAEGEGAFHHTVERNGEQSHLHGETAIPIEGGYELSLRLRRRGAARNSVELRLPHCRGVEREHGWLAVEVPGKLQIAETSKNDLVAVTVAELPTEARSSAVSPVLKAYRHYANAPMLSLSVERLPEQELEDSAIDAVEATSVVAAEGKLVTEMRIALRNASRPSLAITLPPSTEVRSALRDGEPIRPSRDESGRLLLPLARSGGEGFNEPILLEIVFESSVPPLGLFGASELVLPALDLDAAAWKWRLHLPTNNQYGDLMAQLEQQRYAGAVSWHKPPHLKRAVRWNEEEGAETRVAKRSSNSLSGILGSGVEKVHERYWVSAGESVRVRVPFVRGFLVLPTKMSLGLLGVLGAVLIVRRKIRSSEIRARFSALVRNVRTRFPARVRAWVRRQRWTGKRVAHAVFLGTGALVIGWMFMGRMGSLFKILWAIVAGEA